MMIILCDREKNMIDRGSTWFKNKDKWSTILRKHHKEGIFTKKELPWLWKEHLVFLPNFSILCFEEWHISSPSYCKCLPWPSHTRFYLWILNLTGRCLCKCNLSPFLTAHIQWLKKYMFKGLGLFLSVWSNLEWLHQLQCPM